MIDPRCMWKTLWRSFRCGAHVEGHEYVLTEEVESAKVTILRCEDCGHYDVSWEAR